MLLVGSRYHTCCHEILIACLHVRCISNTLWPTKLLILDIIKSILIPVNDLDAGPAGTTSLTGLSEKICKTRFKTELKDHEEAKLQEMIARSEDGYDTRLSD